MKLQEWQDAKGNKISVNSVANSGSASSGSFKKRFERLLDYAQAHKIASVSSATVNSISDDSFSYSEKIRGGYSYYDREISVYIGSQTEAWRLKIYIDNKIDEDIAGQGWPELLKMLRYYITVPVTTTLEYKELITEWLDSKGQKVSNTGSHATTPASSKTNKEKFTSLLYYMKKHKSITTDKAEVVRLDDGGFTYKEHRVSGATKNEFTLTLLVGYSRFNSQWSYELYRDTSLIEEKSGNGFEELIGHMYAYFNTPKPGSKEHKDLCEWVDAAGKKIGQASSNIASTKNYQDHTYRYQRLLAQIDADKICKYTVNLLDDRILAITLNNGVGVKIIFKPYVPCYLVQVDGYDNNCKDYEEVLKLLIIEGIISDTDLCESASYADDFKLYENLWS